MEDIRTKIESGGDQAQWLDPATLRGGAVDPNNLQLGRIVSVSGTQVIAILDADICGANGLHELRKGEVVKMTGLECRVFGMVSGLTIPVPDPKSGGEVLLAEIELIGEILVGPNSAFRRGVSKHPALGEAIYPAEPGDLEAIYDFTNRASICIGWLHQARARPAHVSVDGLLGKHFSMLGSTGSGKSCAVALVLRRMLERHTNAHIMLLDPHGEYSAAFPTSAEIISPSTMELPYWLFNAEEICEVVAAGREDGGHVEEALILLKELIPQARKAYAKTIGFPEAQISVDTPTPYSMREVHRLIDEQLGKFEKTQASLSVRWLKNRLEGLRNDARYSFMFGGLTVRDNMADILRRLFRVPVGGKPLTIVDLSGVPSEILNVVISVLSRMTFDFALWSRGAYPMLLVCEEAHRYVPADNSIGFGPTKAAISRIAKEGRKYGVSLAIISQRPAEIDPTILSQCNTTMAFRITNINDQQIVRGVMTDSAHGLLDFLPSLGTGEVIVAGEAVPVPQRMVLDILPEGERPKSATAQFSQAWSLIDDDSMKVDAIVDAWRRQTR